VFLICFTPGVPGDFALILSVYSSSIQLSLIKIMIMNAAQALPQFQNPDDSTILKICDKTGWSRFLFLSPC